MTRMIFRFLLIAYKSHFRVREALCWPWAGKKSVLFDSSHEDLQVVW